MATARTNRDDRLLGRWYFVQCLSALGGVILALYLLVQHTRLKSGIQGGASFCSLGAYADCDVVNASPYADIAGIPLAALGAVFYFALLALAVVAQPRHPGFARSQWALGWLAVLGLGIDVALLAIQIAALKNFCILCCATYLCTLVTLLAAAAMARQPGQGMWSGLKAALSVSRARQTGKLPGPRVALALVVGGLFLAVVAMLPSFVRSGAPSQERLEEALAQFWENWKKLPVKDIAIKDGDGIQGSSSARVRVVVFSDFQCPFCKKAAFTLSTALAPYRDRVLLAFKHYPLDPECNLALQYKLHAYACRLAQLAFCARTKQKFWEFHDRIFFNLEESDFQKGEAHVQSMVREILPPAEYTQCLKAKASLENVQADIQLGNSLGVRGTPTVFINGKLFTIPLTVENLQKVIEVELGE